jgi:signal transduction histidine kinase
LLRLSEIEAGRRPTAQVQVPLADFLLDLAETMEPVIADAGSCLMVGELAPLWVSGDLGMLQQMLVNLLENIALHTPAGTRATLAVVQDGAEAVITVADNGPGIAPGERNRVVRPFESGAKAANARPNGGNGLGLAIAEAVMRFHKGTLELADNRPGLAVRLRFPLGA